MYGLEPFFYVIILNSDKTIQIMYNFDNIGITVKYAKYHKAENMDFSKSLFCWPKLWKFSIMKELMYI